MLFGTRAIYKYFSFSIICSVICALLKLSELIFCKINKHKNCGDFFLKSLHILLILHLFRYLYQRNTEFCNFRIINSFLKYSSNFFSYKSTLCNISLNISWSSQGSIEIIWRKLHESKFPSKQLNMIPDDVRRTE